MADKLKIFCDRCGKNIQIDIPSPESNTPRVGRNQFFCFTPIEMLRFITNLLKEGWIHDFTWCATDYTTKNKFIGRSFCPECKDNRRKETGIY
jgi:hypothetical protein